MHKIRRGWWYVIALVVIILFLMILFRDEINFSSSKDTDYEVDSSFTLSDWVNDNFGASVDTDTSNEIKSLFVKAIEGSI